MMSIFKRGWLYVTRKKNKTILMFFILFSIATAILSGVAIQKATSITRNQINQSMGAYFSLSTNPMTNPGIGTRGMGIVPKEIVDKIKKIDGITKYDVKTIGEAELTKEEQIPLRNKATQFNENVLKDYKKIIDLSGNRNSKNDTKFTSGTLKLTQGRHLTAEDKHKVLIHEEFAKLNHLEIGSTLTIKPSSKSSLTEFEEKEKPETLDLEVIGLFSGSNQQIATMPYELIENILISDIASTQEINGFSDKFSPYQEAKFYTDNPQKLEKILEKVKGLDVDWNLYQLIPSNKDMPGLTNSLDSMDKLVRQLLLGVFFISIVILSLILAFWMNGRVHETGILLSLGKSKINIISQYIIELLMIAIFSFGLSYFSSNYIAQKIGDELITQANKTSQSMLNQGVRRHVIWGRC